MKQYLFLFILSAFVIVITQSNESLAMFEVATGDPACKQLYQACYNGGQCVHHLGVLSNPLVCRRPGQRCYIQGHAWQLKNNQLQCLP